MAKITILLIALSLQVSANIYAQQQVTLNVKNAPLLDVLSSIREQTGYIYMMRAANSKLAKPVTINLQSVNLETALQQIFLNQPFTFKLESNTIRIVVKPELEKKSSSTSSEEGQQKDINGYVKDEKGNPLQGATIILKEQNNRVTVSDGDGRFSFANAPDQGTILVRMIGRETREIKYQKGNTVSIVLKEVNMKMNEVQIIAYGEVKKTDLTSNISSVKGSVIAQAPVTNMLYALEGRVPGLYIQQTSGVSGNGVNVTIQGINSIANGNIPFYVIDGVPYAQNVIQTNVRQITSGIGNAMGFINPSDIASIEILKDADATAIYGSRAANGAILITTKKGKAGQTKVDVDMQSGWGKVAKKIDLLNTQQYLSLRFEALKNGNRTPGPSDYDINGEWDQTRNTNWQKELIGGTSQYQNMNASVSGGNENTQFMAGTGYLRETTVFPGNFSDSKISFHVNLHHSSKNNRFKFDLSANYLQGTNRLPQADLTSYILTPPDAPALYNSDGTINWAPSKTNPDISTFSNPIASLNQKYTAKTNNLISNGQVSYEIVSDLILKISMGYNRLETNEVSTAPWTSINPSFRSFIPRSANYATSAVESWISEPQLNYSKELSFGHLDALIGGTFQQTNNDMNSIYAEGFANDAQLENLQAAPTVRVTGYLKSIYKYSAIFGRINYKLNDKYILNLTARRDGSSRFGPANLFHNFYAIGGAWIFSNEHFIQKNLPFLNFGKLRLSYGTTGNDQIGEYQFLDLYNNYVVDIPYQNTVALTANGLSNPYLQWEETRKINLGIDLGVLENRIALTANYFRNRSSNQLLGYHVSGVSGFNTIIRNLPATVQNTGWEFLLETTPIRRNKFNWSNSINLTIPKNKLIRYDDLDNNSTFVVGQSLNLFKAYDYAGVNSQTGLYQFINSKGELTSTPDAESDRTVLIDLNPKWYGGFSNTITYQNWNLSFLFQYVKRYNINSRYPLLPGRSSLNTTTNVLNHWKAAGDDAEIQKVTSDFLDVYASATAVNSSNAVYADGSYARLKNLSLSYNFPQAWLSKLHINHARLYAQGQNLLTFTKYFGGDPETSSQLSLPPLRIYTVGLQITL